jgi:hypothetical protein
VIQLYGFAPVWDRLRGMLYRVHDSRSRGAQATTTTKKSLERTGAVLVWTMAGMQMVTAMSGYVLPPEVHLAMGKVFYGAYAPEQFPVLDSHYVVSFFHRFGGFLFMALVPLQFMPRLRARHITFHRWSGRVLVAVGVIFGVSALVMAGRFPYAGTREIIPMFFFGLMFLYCIIRAFLEVRRRNVALHREWIIRGAALGLAAATIRAVYVVCLYTTDWSIQDVLITSLWLGWSLNLLIAECWINYTRPKQEIARLASAGAE